MERRKKEIIMDTTQCKTCKHAIISNGKNVMKVNTPKGIIEIVQHGKHNITCGNSAPKSISITDGELSCSGFMPKEGE